MKMNKWKLSGWIFGAIVAVSLLIYLWNYVSPEFAKFVGYLIGGVLAVWQVVASNRRATAAEKTAESMEKGNVAERFKNAIEHLGHESVSVRLGGIYALHHIAQEEENYRKRVFEILCAHIRETTVDESYKQRSSVPRWGLQHAYGRNPKHFRFTVCFRNRQQNIQRNSGKLAGG